MIKKIIITSFYFFLLQINLVFGQKVKSMVEHSPFTHMEYGLKIIDSLKSMGVDTIFGYNYYVVHSSENENFNIIYIQKSKTHQITLIKAKHSSDGFSNQFSNSDSGQLSNSFLQIFEDNANSIYFDIVFSNEQSLLKILNNSRLFQDTIINKNGSMLVGGLLDHGNGYFFYLKIGKTEKSGDYCCSITLNEKIYKRAFPLWLLASAFNNYNLIDSNINW